MPPIDQLTTLNDISEGQAVPIKFSLKGFKVMDILAEGYQKSQSIACNSSAPQDDVETAETAGNCSLRYDAASDTYSYISKTDKSWAPGTCGQLIVKLALAQFYPN